MWTNADLPDIGYGWAFHLALFMLMAVVPSARCRILVREPFLQAPAFLYLKLNFERERRLYL